jgi:hypothetical protein
MRIRLGGRYSNHSVLIDDKDFAILYPYSWYGVEGGKTIYAQTNIRVNNGYVGIFMHRMLILDIPNGYEIDHINRNGLYNFRSNLRIVTRVDNIMNQSKRSGEFTSKYKGVSWMARSKRWYAHIKVNGKVKGGELFMSEEIAAIRYNELALQYYGKFAYLNPIGAWR